MYTNDDLQKAKNVIDNANNIAILIHQHPDADAIGSAVAMHTFLKKEGKVSTIFSPSEIPDWLTFLTSDKPVRVLTGNSLGDGEVYDLIIFTDGGEYNRFAELGNFNPPEDTQTLRFDHHKEEIEIAKVPIFSDEVSSTAEIIYDFFRCNEVTITKDIAKSLLVGILGDTGWLKYSNTTIKTTETVTALIDINNCLPELDYHFNHSSKIKILPVWQLLMKKMVVDEANRFLFSYVSYEEIWSLGLSKKDFINAYNTFLDKVMRGFSDVNISALFLEIDKGLTHGTVRSERKSVHIGNLCAEFENGGGHPQAGGFSTKKSLDDILKVMYEGMEKFKL